MKRTQANLTNIHHNHINRRKKSKRQSE